MDTKKICFILQGCAEHKEEFQRILKNLEEKYEEVKNPVKADVIVQYFCAITSYSVEQIYGQMQFLKAIKRLRPHMKLIVCGCAAEVIDFKKLYPMVDFCSKRENLVKNILQFLQEQYKTEEFDMKVERGRVVINIGTGCNNRCSFCKWGYMSMKLISKPIEEIIEEVKKAVRAGAKGIALSAHNSTQYGIDLYNKPMLLELLKEIVNNFKKEVIELTGVTVVDVTEELIDFIKQEERIHVMQLESQSASNLVRKKMSLGSSVERLEEVLDAFSNKTFMTNWMIGHPYEGEEQFQETLDFIKRKKMWNVTYGTYQNTPGIESSKMPQITEEEKNKRTNRFIEVVMELRKEFFDSLIGKTIKAYPYKTNYYEEGKYEIFLEGKEIECIIVVEMAESEESKKIVAQLDYFQEVLVKIVRVEEYFMRNQKVILEGQLI